MKLTEEAIIASDWELTGRSIDVWFTKSGDFERTTWTASGARMHYNLEDHWMTIEILDFTDWYTVFKGKVETIEDFWTVLALTCLN